MRLIADRKLPRRRHFHSLPVLEQFESRILLSGTFPVTNLNDSGTGSLRAEIVAFNAAGGGDIAFGSTLAGTVNLASSLPAFTSPGTLMGPGANKVTLNGGKHGAVLTLDASVSAGSTPTDFKFLEISQLTITGGSAGGIADAALVEVLNCTVTGNTNATGNGGGISVTGTGGSVNLRQSTVSGNSAILGGGVYEEISTAEYDCLIANSTITGNTATQQGGGIYAPVILEDGTVSGNKAAQGGGVYQLTSGVFFLGTIVAGNTGGDLATAAGVTLSGDNDLIGDGSDGGAFTLSLRGTKASPLNPKLGALAYNGGQTETLALLPGSPAIGTGVSLSGGPGGITTDQRGDPRPVTGVDIGAYQTSGTSPHLVFHVQPSNANAGSPMSPAIVVYIENSTNQIITTDNSTVLLVAFAGGFTLHGTTSVAAVKGIATFSNIIIDQPGTAYTVVAEDGDDVGFPSTPFNVNVGPAASLVAVSQPTTAVAGQTVVPGWVVKVEDLAGNIVTNSTAKITLVANGTALLGQTTVTPVNGVATFSGVLMDTAGSFYLGATSPGLNESLFGNPVAVAAGPLAKLEATGAPLVYAGVTTTLVELIPTDKFGNGVPVTATFSIISEPPGGQIYGPTTTTNNGYLAYAKIAGVYTVVAKAGSITSNTTTITIVPDQFNPTMHFITEPQNAVAGVKMKPFVGEYKDEFGNVIPMPNGSASITLAVSQGPSTSYIGTNVASVVNNLFTFSNLTFDVTGTYILEVVGASGIGSLGAVTTSFKILPNPLKNLALVHTPGNIIAGVAISPAVTVKATDAFGNLIAGLSVNLALGPGSSSGPLLGTLTAITNASGIATFSGLSIHKTGSYSLVASVGTVKSAVSAAFKVFAAAPSKLAFTTLPTPAIHGQATMVKVSLEDAFGNVVTKTNTGTVSLALGTHPTNAALSGGTPQNFINGVATFTDLILSLKGSYSLIASDSIGIAADTSVTFTVA